MARVLALLLVLACLPGCAAWQKAGGPKAIECAGDKLGTRVVLVVPVVMAALAHEDYEAKLAELGKTVGLDVLGCALQHVHLSAPPVRAKTSKLLGAAR